MYPYGMFRFLRFRGTSPVYRFDDGRAGRPGRYRRWMLGLGVLLLTAVSALGCSGANGAADQERYDNDGFLGITDANPNLQTSPTHYNYNDEFRMVRKTLEGFEPVETYRVHIDGGRMIVDLKLKDRAWTRNEIEQVEFEALDALQHQFPRYTVDLTSDRSRVRRNEQK